MEQKQVLDNLYALRAGLSVISQQLDKAQTIEGECDEKLSENVERLNGALVCYDDYDVYPELKKLQGRYGYKKDLTEEYNVIEENTKDTFGEKLTKKRELKQDNDAKGKKAFNRWLAYDECEGYFNNLYGSAYQEKKILSDFSYKKGIIRNTVLAIVFFSIAAVLAVVLIAVRSGAYENWSRGIVNLIRHLFDVKEREGMIRLVFYVIIPLIVLSILFFVFTGIAISATVSYKKSVNEANDRIMAAQWLLDNLPKTKENARIILSEKDKKIVPIKDCSNEFYMALKKQFSCILDERDWKNLDLVIYELETRRADSVKEALQLVDRELQTERIQQILVQATEQICYEIRRGFAEMRETIKECCRVISAQLSTVSMQLAYMNIQLNDLCDSVNMSNALQAKANVTSEQLIRQVQAMRNYS
ncbi:MAG: hypothetical protein K2J61_00920 [Clostridia bacterium]|nr:hypothetical protein [Clostridia bacterium]